jgi:hypothetical protein
MNAGVELNLFSKRETIGAAGVVTPALTSAQRRLISLEAAARDLTAKYRVGVLCTISICYVLVTLALSQRKLLWTDEFFTLFLSRLNLHELWSALLTGGDQHPPLFYLMHHGLLQLFGEHVFTLRLPAIVGFLLMMLCVYKFVACRTSVAYGLVAMVVPLVTIAHQYAYEARGYGPSVGFFALALLCWQQTSIARWRIARTIGMAFALTAGVCSHYYTLFLIPSIAVAEITRSLRCGSWKIGAWLGMCAPIVPLIAFLPAIRAGQNFAATFWGKTSAIEIYRYYENLFSPGILCLLLCFVVGGMYRFIWPRDGDAALRRRQLVPPEEIVLGLMVSAVPIVLYVVGKTFTGVFAWRYALGGVVGIAILFGLSCFRLFRGKVTAAWLIVSIISLCFGMIAWLNMHELANQRASVRAIVKLTDGMGSESEPLIIGDSQMFYVLSYYAPPATKNHYLYLFDTARSMKYLHQDTPDRSLAALNPWFGLNIRPYASYIESHPHLKICTSLSQNWDWLPFAVVDEGKKVSLDARIGLVFLLSVDAAPRNERER